MDYPLSWPSILVPSAEAWNPNAGASRSGGRSLSGGEQIVAGPSGYVTASLTVPCNNRSKVLAMRALLAGLDGRLGTVRVGPFEVGRAPWWVDPLTGGKVTYCRGNRDANKAPAWDSNPDTSSDLDFSLQGAHSMNAVLASIQRVRGGFLEPGMWFSVGNRLHMLTRLTTADPAGSDGEAAPGVIGVELRPWLRADYDGATAVEFGTPRGLMRLASDDTGALELQLSRSGVVTLDLVEAV